MWALIVLAVLAGLFVLAVSVPLEADFELEVAGKTRFRVKLVWLFGLVRRELMGARPARPEAAAEARRKRSRKRPDLGLLLDILRTKGLLSRIKRLLRDVFACFQIRKLGADFRVGLDDPADTGILFACFSPLAVWLELLLPRLKVRFSFAGESCFEGTASGEVRLVPIRLAPPFLGFIFSLPVLRVFKKLIKRRWKRK